jgi:hypothetical protein
LFNRRDEHNPLAHVALRGNLVLLLVCQYVSLFLAYASAVGLLLVLPLDLTLTRLRREADTLELFNTHER